MSSIREIDEICDAFEADWQAGQQPSVRQYMKKIPEENRGALAKELIPLDVECRAMFTELPDANDHGEFGADGVKLAEKAINELRARGTNPAIRPVITGQAAVVKPDKSESDAALEETLNPRDPMLSSRPGSGGEVRQPGDHIPRTKIGGPGNESSTATYISRTAIGVQQERRYRLDRNLGEGGFGRVYLGYDEELQRQVAIKVPTKERFQKAEDTEAYLAEDRTVASLDHPHIVPVYDVGRTQDDSIYVVSRFIEGATLEDRIKAGRTDERESAQLLAAVARALQHAHDRRLIHRDIKRANILLENKSGAAFVADFGLAIREEDYLNEMAIAGTPAYMSPEQARGEGHRLDGRRDIICRRLWWPSTWKPPPTTPKPAFCAVLENDCRNWWILQIGSANRIGRARLLPSRLIHSTPERTARQQPRPPRNLTEAHLPACFPASDVVTDKKS